MNNFDYELLIRKIAFDCIVAAIQEREIALYIPDNIDKDKFVDDVRAYVKQLIDRAEAQE